MPDEGLTDAILTALGSDARRVAEGEWGLTVEAAGWPLHVGLAVRRGLLRAQAQVVGPGVVDPHELLLRNRSLALVRFGETRAGEVWVVGDLPVAAVTAEAVDRLLGTLVEAATDARYAARRTD